MRLDKDRLKHPTVVRTCSLLLVLLILCSAFVVGDMSGVYAVAVEDSQADLVMTGDQPVRSKVQAQAVGASTNGAVAGTKIYIDLSNAASWWLQGLGNNAKPAVHYWNNSGMRKTKFLTLEDANSHLYSYTFNDDCVGIIIGSAYNESDSASTLIANNAWQRTKDITDPLKTDDRITVLADGSGTPRGYDISRSHGEGNFYTSKIGYKNESHSTGYGADGVTLFPVSAQFYDYYTDYEITNGWRKVVGRNDDASRTYTHSFPFKTFNTYLSNMANSANWEVPLYFGNFFTGSGYYYRTFQQTMKFNGDATPDGKNESAPLYKFSAQVNNSMYLNGTNNASSSDTNKYSVIGLANNVLNSNGQLTMGTGSIESPYFSDTTVSAGYATKVTTEFPFRVEEKTDSGNNGKYYYIQNNSSITCKAVWVWDAGSKNSERRNLELVDQTNNIYRFVSTIEVKGLLFFDDTVDEGATSWNDSWNTHKSFQDKQEVSDWSTIGEGVLSISSQSQKWSLQTSKLSDERWISGQSIAGSGVKYKTYSFDSWNGKDNVYFSGYGNATDNEDTTSLTLNYSTQKMTHDAITGFSGDSSDQTNNYNKNGIGFFPFDNENGVNGNSTPAYDFGFGMRLDIPFMLTENGKINGTDIPIKFSFSGDDDVWIFVDDQLALDLGGDHCRAEGEIDFAEETSTISTGVYKLTNSVCANPDTYNATGTRFAPANNAVTASTLTADLSDIIDKSNPNRVHTLTVFYMERGMSESNLKMEFTMTPIENNLVTENNVDVTGVNEGLRQSVETAVKNDKSTVKYTEVKDGSNVNIDNYTYTKSDGGEYKIGDVEDGKNPLNFGESNSFNGQFKSGSSITANLEFDSGNSYQYDTTYEVTDEYLNTVIKNGKETDTGSFIFKTTSQSYLARDYFKISYLNKPKTVPITLSKQVQFADGKVDSTNQADFEFTVEIKLPGESEYRTYALDYSGEQGSQTMGADGKISLKHGDKITIEGIPVGSSVRITEKADPNVENPRYVVYGDDYVREFTNLTDQCDVEYINRYAGNPPASFNPKALKSMIQNNEVRDLKDGEIFTFNIEECDSDGNVKQGGNHYTASAENKLDGSIAFTQIEFDKAGTYYYKITEAENADKANIYILDEKAFYLKVEVVYQSKALIGNLNIDESTVTGTYYSDKSMSKEIATVVLDTKVTTDEKGIKTIDRTENVTSGDIANVKFTNTVRIGDLELKKTFSDNPDMSNDEVLNSLKTVEFAYYRVDGNKQLPATDVPTGTITATDENCKVDGNSLVFTATGLEIGWYAIKETKAPSGYELHGDYIWVEIKENKTAATGSISDVKNTAELENIKSTELPKSGGMGVAIFVVVGVVLVVVGILLLKPKKSKAEKPTGKSNTDNGEQ